MKRALLSLTLLVLSTAPAALAQEPAMDDDRALSTEQMHRMMEAHEHLMSDSLYHAHMMADTSLQSAMREMMSPEMAEMHAKMMAMPHAERMAMMKEMHEQMMARMDASPEDFHAFHERMVKAHSRALADPELRERLMADPEMRQMMEQLHEDGMMDGDRMMDDDHGDMDDHHMMDDHDEHMEDGGMEGDTNG